MQISADELPYLPAKVALDGVVQFSPDVTMTVYDSGDWEGFEDVFCCCMSLVLKDTATVGCHLVLNSTNTMLVRDFMFPESASTAQERPSSQSKGW